jgi:hypothetical protein
MNAVDRLSLPLTLLTTAGVAALWRWAANRPETLAARRPAQAKARAKAKEQQEIAQMVQQGADE